MMIKIFYYLAFFTLFIQASCATAKSNFSHLDPDQIIPKVLLNKTLDYYQAHLESIHNKHFIGIIDFKLHNSKERFYLLDMESGKVDKFLVAHGRNSDPNFDGYANKFSNEIDSKMSSLGFYLTAETYVGEHGYSLRLDGLSSTNSKARERSIVIHPADYVFPGEKIGRSFGCPAVEPRFNQHIIDSLKEGALLFASFE